MYLTNRIENMNKKLETQLVERFPTFFRDYGKSPRESCMAFGCDHGDGWFDILWKLCENIEKTQYKDKFYFQQIKEKFAALRIYYTPSNPELDTLIEKAEQESLNVCEQCGSKQNVTTNSEGWLTTMCETCRNKSKPPR